MKEFVLQVPENKVRFFNELVQSLGFVKAEEIGDSLFELPEPCKKMVSERIESVKPSGILDWDETNSKLRLTNHL